MLPNSRLMVAFDVLDAYVQSHHWVGYNAFDLKGHPTFLRLQQNHLVVFPAKAAVNLFPMTLRRVFKIQWMMAALARPQWAVAIAGKRDLETKQR